MKFSREKRKFQAIRQISGQVELPQMSVGFLADLLKAIPMLHEDPTGFTDPRRHPIVHEHLEVTRKFFSGALSGLTTSGILAGFTGDLHRFPGKPFLLPGSTEIHP